ncbi:MAG: hypothetical protein KIT14_01910 [bacterium]|nr:hypothetical protein [bacterium]
MADGRRSGDTGLAAIGNGVLILLTIVGAIVLVAPDLRSDRPPSPQAAADAIGGQVVDARLWEDPFRPADRSTRSLRDLVAEVEQRSARGPVRLLPVMVSGGPYSEEHEDRIRSRFAVVSALGQSGYVPADDGHLGTVCVDWLYVDIGVGLPPACTAEAACPTRRELRYEWYRPRVFFARPDGTTPPEVLMMWLDERAFKTNPARKLADLLRELIYATQAQSGTEVDEPVHLVGPASSETLRALLSDEQPADESPRTQDVLRHVALFSARARAMDEVLVQGVAPGATSRATVAERLQAQVGFAAAHFFNADDARLAQEVFRELARRGLCLAPSDICGDVGKDHLVLVSEWDTFYGRILPMTYGAELAVLLGKTESRAQFVDGFVVGAQSLQPNLHTMVYLRGLDGRTVGDARPETGAGARGPQPPGSFEELLRWTPAVEKAEGSSQFDHLTRAAERLEALRRDVRRSGGDVRAIGVVGSDFYDVLLLLRALRPRFPDVLFFTTELDARHLHPDNRKVSRNLIIASSHGFMLDASLQRDVAPFRDSVQTAQFAAVLAALDAGKIPALTQSDVPVRLFEIGNAEAVDLSASSPAGALPVHPPTTRERYARGLELGWGRDIALGLLLVGLAVLLLLYFAVSSVRPRTACSSGYLGGCLSPSDADVGGLRGAQRLLVVVLGRSDPMCRWIAARLDDWKNVRPPAGVADAGTTPNVETEAQQELRRQQEQERQAAELLAVLNAIVDHAAPRPSEATVRASTLIDPDRVERAAPWTAPEADWWTPSRLRQRVRTRALVDQLLDRLGYGTSTPNAIELIVARDARLASRETFVVRLRLIRRVGFLVASALILGGILATTLWNETFLLDGGEPFSVSSGVSAWPNLVLRVLSTLAAVGFSLWLFEKLRVLSWDLTRAYRLPLSAGAETQSPLRVDASALWMQLHEGGEPWRRAVRAAVPTVLYFGCARLVLLMFGLPFQPLRGTTVTCWAEAVRFPFVLSFLFLSFLTVDASLRCRRFVNALATLQTRYPATTLEYFRRQRGGVAEEYLEEWIDTQLIADLTEGVGRLLWFPVAVFVLMAASLIPWTDHWPVSHGLLAVLLVNLGLSIVSVVILQRAAQSARAQAEASLTAKVKRAQGLVAASREKIDATQAERLLDEIRALDRGAFVGFWQNPALGAVLVPSGGTALVQLVLWAWG